MIMSVTPSALLARPLSLRLGLVALLAVVFTLATGLVDGGVGVGSAQALSQPIFPVANALPGLLLAILLLVLSRRALLSFGLAFLLQALVYGVNALKVSNLNTPLMPADFRMLGQLRRGGFSLLGSYLPASPWPYLALLGALAVIVAAWRWSSCSARCWRACRAGPGSMADGTCGSNPGRPRPRRSIRAWSARW
jgi:phosphoglycerol transferase MdoB-like AlkP superfamily enzyme